MKKVVCINNRGGYEGKLTVGKEYEVENDGDPALYKVKNSDNGRFTVGYKSRFKDIENVGSKYTKDYLKKNKIVVKVTNEEEFKKILTLIRGKVNYEFPRGNKQVWIIGSDGTYAYSDNWPERYGYEVVEMWQINFEDEKRKIIGYISPMDLFEGKIKKGTIFKQDTKDGTVYWPEHLRCDYVPKEIAETWEPVYEEEEIKFAGHTLEILAGAAKFGCQSLTLQDIESIRRLFNSEFKARITIHGEEVTLAFVDKVLSKLK